MKDTDKDTPRRNRSIKKNRDEEIRSLTAMLHRDPGKDEQQELDELYSEDLFGLGNE